MASSNITEIAPDLFIQESFVLEHVHERKITCYAKTLQILNSHAHIHGIFWVCKHQDSAIHYTQPFR